MQLIIIIIQKGIKRTKLYTNRVFMNKYNLDMNVNFVKFVVGLHIVTHISPKRRAE